MRSFVFVFLGLMGLSLLVVVEANDGAVAPNPTRRRRRRLSSQRLEQNQKQRELEEMRRKLHVCDADDQCPGYGTCNLVTELCECGTGGACAGICEEDVESTDGYYCNESCHDAWWICNFVQTCEDIGDGEYGCVDPGPLNCTLAQATECGEADDGPFRCEIEDVIDVGLRPRCTPFGCFCIPLQQAIAGVPFPTALWDLGTIYQNVPVCECAACGIGCPGMRGDPHVMSWTGEWFDYHGECDLKLVHAPHFDGQQDMDIHVRTKIRYDYSFIEAAAIKIGNDVLEVASFGSYALNGVEDAMKPNLVSVPTVGGYPIYHSIESQHTHRFDIVIKEHENITISTFKDWVSVHMNDVNQDEFANVSGLLGSYKGKLLGRNGTDLHEDINALGQDWQIQSHEEVLFRTVRAPQAPQKCSVPDPKALQSRRLQQGVVDQTLAEEACAQFQGHAFSFCVHDVMSSGDLEIAQGQVF